MKWLTIEYIKAHSRIDFDCEDSKLELYGSAAEDVVLETIRRTMENVTDIYGEVPAKFYQAALQLTDLAYMQSSPISSTNMSVVPYTFDMLIADYIRHDKASNIQAELDTLKGKLKDCGFDLNYNYYEIENPTDEQTSTYEDLYNRLEALYAKAGKYKEPTSKICAKLRVKVNSLIAECETAFDEE